MDAPTPPSDSETEFGFRVPAPPARPGETPNFASLDKGAPGDVPRLAVDAPVDAFAPYHHKLLRVLNDEGRAEGPWADVVNDTEKKTALLAMMRTRAFDQRMMRAQRQGKTSFYIQCLGEEAIGAGAALSTNTSDMHFPTYRQQSILLTRNIDPERMMNQIYSNEKDSLKGKQLPVLYSFREVGFFTISGNLATQWAQGVGWAMASAMRQDDKVAIAWIGDGATAEGDWHWGNLFAAVYRAPCLLCVVNNQWAISSTNAFAGGDLNTFAARLASYGLPALRVDGNDLLAVVAACRFAVQRARMGLGAVGIEFVTYRGGAHSTSDDPTKYRPKDELSAWPLGDPIERLKQHLLINGVMTADDIAAQEQAAEIEMRDAERRAEEHGLVHDGRGASPSTMFDQVYEELPGRLVEQQDEAGH
ncbi:MAG: thiamine pyrophosphate-dependent dehydrogenase E1 component subunit alpha [Pseudomonadota bacterium]